MEGGIERERGGSLGFQYESEWEKGRWEGKVGGCEERAECMGGRESDRARGLRVRARVCVRVVRTGSPYSLG